jgi:hypothetical protein
MLAQKHIRTSKYIILIKGYLRFPKSYTLFPSSYEPLSNVTLVYEPYSPYIEITDLFGNNLRIL